ncbi:MAG: Abi family protein, partial [Duncaniella sp.]|nr:Abi family protein [Duncaniella sp.]
NIYSNIKDKKIKKSISQRFGLQIAPFESWLTIMSLTRNICCHHSRAWNRRFTLLPMVPNRICHPWISLPTDRLRIYFNFCIIKYFINIISPQNTMSVKLRQLLADFPEVDTAAMGFPTGWDHESLWTT